MAFEIWNPPVKPRVNGTSLKKDQAINEVSFGDGYEQTSPDGINSIRETWTLSWPGIFNADADAIEWFWNQKGKVVAFWYQVPGRATAKRYKFTAFDRPQVSGAMDAVSVGIREVFDIED